LFVSFSKREKSLKKLQSINQSLFLSAYFPPSQDLLSPGMLRPIPQGLFFSWKIGKPLVLKRWIPQADFGKAFLRTVRSRSSEKKHGRKVLTNSTHAEIGC